VFRDDRGRLEYPPEHVGRRTYVTVKGYNYSVPKIYCYMGSDRRYHVIGESFEETPGAPMIMRDLEPYRSPLDGSMVTSRSQHRAHMRQHGVIEMGNERPRMQRQDVALPSVGADIKRAMGKL
jgi:hypothetical protein